MTRQQQIWMESILLGVGTVAVYKWWHEEPMGEAVVPGLVLGVAVGAARVMAGEEGMFGQPVMALGNSVTDGMGTLDPEAVRFLEEVARYNQADNLYAPTNLRGVKIGPVPDEPSIVNQEP
jgi:hypothetical protein